MKRETIVSIRNLHEVSEMDVLEFITAHLLSQRKMSRTFTPVLNRTICRYKHDDLRCAAGCLIPDEDYRPEMEGNVWYTLINKKMVPPHHAWVIAKAQSIHDFTPVKAWAEELQKLKEKVQHRAAGFAS